MGNLFGTKKKKETRVTEQDRAVLQLKQQRDKLHQYQKKIQVQLSKERELAKRLLKDGKKNKALLLLRKKKFQEGLLEKTDGQLENIERMVHDLEFAQIETQVIAGLKSGNEALQKMHELMSLEDVERILDEAHEGAEYQREIDALLAGGLTEEDEEDVLNELEDILNVTLPDVPAGEEEVNLPDVPDDEIKENRTKEKTKAEAVMAT